MALTFRALGRALARAASDKKAEEIVLLDVRRQSPVTEYMLIATVTSPPHLEALEDALRKDGLELHCPSLRRARPASDRWRVLDFGGLLAHFMTDEARRFYNLEKLYHQARPVTWDDAPQTPAKTPKRRKTHA